MAAEMLAIGVTAELADFKKAMATLPDIGAQEARDMVRGIQRQLKEAEKAAATSAKQVGDSFDKEFGRIENAAEASLGKMGSLFHDSFGELADVIFDVVAPLQEAGSGMGGLTGAALMFTGTATLAAAGLAALGAGAVTIANAGVEARDRLKEIGVAVDASKTAQLKAYEVATSDLGVAFDELKVAVGAELASDLSTMASATATVVREFSDLYDTLSSVREVAQEVASVGLFLVTGGLTGVAAATLEVAAANNDASASYAGVTKNITEATAKAAAYNNMLVESQLVFDELDIEYDKRLVRLSEEAAALEAAAAAEQRKLEADQQERAALADMLETLDSVIAKEREYAEAVQQASAAVEQAVESERQAYLDAYRSKEQARQIEIDQELERAELMKQLQLEIAAASILSAEQLTGALVAGWQRRAEEEEHFTSQEKAQAIAAFEIQQGLATAGATLSAFQTGANVIASLTAVGVPFPAASILGIAATGAVLTGQVAQIEQQAPPEFPMGLSPDHRQLVAIQPERELIVNGRGAADPEVRDTVRRANRGERIERSGGQAPEVTIHLDPRLKRLRVEQGRVGKKPPRRR